MSIDEVVKRINFLYSKSKTLGLTENEKVEQKKLRKRYIDNIKKNFRAQLDNMVEKPNNEM
ncbi:uncharacterized protein YnzC (UPF0291/DUF896 family) [Clostridium algifaecis]|uniref:UPF0291 protein J2Z42_000416 n=1 Tax=Clostridium algifaecis TaxID=1472040 RepID=A0ABS4KQK6_9CLOT|nr:DUF896 domain-containing protein [Clostridium algifaecis]MBP2031751.1 uncharacterized protein YnzC (UPF0291/DUF896 family) [Clostridium algifaecis]